MPLCSSARCLKKLRRNPVTLLACLIPQASVLRRPLLNMRFRPSVAHPAPATKVVLGNQGRSRRFPPNPHVATTTDTH